MATNLEAFKANLKVAMQSKIGDHRQDLFLLCTPIIANGTVSVVDMDGANKFTQQTTATVPAAASVRAMAGTSNPIVEEMNIPLTDSQMANASEAANYVAQLAIDRAWNKIAEMGFALIFGARVTQHPEHGVSGSPIVATGGGVMYYVDVFTVTPINGGSSYEQTNDHTLELTPTNLRTLLNKRGTYKDKDNAASRPKGKPWLVVGNGLAGIAKNLSEQKGQVFNGSGMQEGFADELAGVIVAPAGVAPDTAWALVWKSPKVGAGNGVTETAPIVLHLSKLPSARVLPQPGGGFVNVYVSWEGDAFYHPNESDLFFSQPA